MLLCFSVIPHRPAVSQSFLTLSYLRGTRGRHLSRYMHLLLFRSVVESLPTPTPGYPPTILPGRMNRRLFPTVRKRRRPLFAPSFVSFLLLISISPDTSQLTSPPSHSLTILAAAIRSASLQASKSRMIPTSFKLNNGGSVPGLGLGTVSDGLFTCVWVGH